MGGAAVKQLFPGRYRRGLDAYQHHFKVYMRYVIQKLYWEHGTFKFVDMDDMAPTVASNQVPQQSSQCAHCPNQENTSNASFVVVFNINGTGSGSYQRKTKATIAIDSVHLYSIQRFSQAVSNYTITMIYSILLYLFYCLIFDCIRSRGCSKTLLFTCANAPIPSMLGAAAGAAAEQDVPDCAGQAAERTCTAANFWLSGGLRLFLAVWPFGGLPYTSEICRCA